MATISTQQVLIDDCDKHLSIAQGILADLGQRGESSHIDLAYSDVEEARELLGILRREADR